MLPDAMIPLFAQNNTIHNYNTRNANKLRAPRIRTNLAEKFITHTGVKIWNEISDIIDPSQKIGTFKFKLITKLIEKYAD
jgi:hypothetical protein